MAPHGVRWARDGALRALLHLALGRPLFLLSAGGLAAALAVAQAVPGWVEAYIESAAMDRELAAMTRLLNPIVTDPQTLLSPASLQGAAGQWTQHFGQDPEGLGIRIWSSAGAPIYSSFPELAERWPPRSPELLAALAGRASVRRSTGADLPAVSGSSDSPLRLIQAYVPLRVGPEVVGAAESYTSARSLDAAIDQPRRQLRLAVVIGQAVLVAGGVLAAGVLSARLRRSHAGLITAKGETERLVASLAAAHEPEEIVRVVEQHLQTSIDADFAALYLLRGQELERQGATAAEGPPAALALTSLPLLRGVMASGSVALVRPPERWEFDQLAGAPLWSVAAAPFALRPEVTGVLLAGRTFGHPFRAEDVHGLQTVVAFALFALDNALAHRELQQRYRRAESWALQDPLTGLANYRAFHDRLEAELTLAAREGLPCALLVADIDRLQRVNERWGLAEGDRRLRETARLLAREGRRGDLAARCGGDEFGLILRGIPLADAISRASRLCRRARTAAPSGPDGSDALDGLSVGVAVFPDHGSSMDEILAAAERAVAHAGREGGGRVSWPELCPTTTVGAR